MPTAFALALAAALAAADAAPAEAAGAPRPGAVVLSVTGGPAWLGGRAGVGDLALDDVSGGGAFLGAEALLRMTPALALGVSAEGTADSAADASAPPCAEGAGIGCDAAYTRFTALARWSFQRAPSREAWASIGTGLERLRIARYGTDGLRLQVRGWEIASLAAGVDWAATRRLGLGLFGSATAGVFTRIAGEDAESVRAPHWAVRGGVRAVVRAGEGVAAPRLPRVSVPRGSALLVEGRAGGAVCGFCGPVLGLALAERAGPFGAGAFLEATLSPVEKFPSQTTPAVFPFTAFAGGFAGAVLRVGSAVRVQLDGELGLQGSRVNVDFLDGPTRTDRAVVPFAGGRARVELVFRGERHAMGLTAFVREPLRTVCLDVGEACDRLGATAGVVLHGTLALPPRAGTETPAPAPEATPPAG